MGPGFRSGIAIPIILTSTVAAHAQAPVDSALARFIATIPAVDNHAHPMRPVRQGEPPDTEFDALPLDGVPPFPIPWRLTTDAPVWARAARVLYGKPAGDTGAAAR